MAVSTRLQGFGTVMSLDSRSGVAKSTGQPFSINTALIVGDGTLVDARVPDALLQDVIAAHRDATPVHVFVTVSTYRDDDQAELTAIRPVQVKG